MLVSRQVLHTFFPPDFPPPNSPPIYHRLFHRFFHHYQGCCHHHQGKVKVCHGKPWDQNSISNSGKYFNLKDVKFLKKTTGIVVKSNKCNQCDYASSHAGHLKTHLKTHSGEKSNKCNQCGRLCLYSGRHFEDTYKNAQWRKITQMQAM